MIRRRARSRAVSRLPRGGIALVLMVVGLVLAAPGYAHADEPSGPEAKLLVLQSIALIANRAPVEVVTERLQDALRAPDPGGTDLAGVAQALVLVERSSTSAGGVADLEQARRLLVSAIDIRFATGYGSTPEPGQVGQDHAPYASGAESGTTAVLDELEPARGVQDWGDVVLLGLGVLAVALGLFLARRWRPRTSIRELRRRSAAPPVAEPEESR